jgi:hypothetical protein
MLVKEALEKIEQLHSDNEFSYQKLAKKHTVSVRAMIQVAQ